MVEVLQTETLKCFKIFGLFFLSIVISKQVYIFDFIVLGLLHLPSFILVAINLLLYNGPLFFVGLNVILLFLLLEVLHTNVRTNYNIFLALKFSVWNYCFNVGFLYTIFMWFNALWRNKALLVNRQLSFLLWR